MSFQIGDSVEAYKIISMVGNGGMGEVFKVEHSLTRRSEAMKVLLSDRISAEEQRQRFLREIRVQASLNHPNIAAVHNAFWVGDELVMVMELVEGDSLQLLLDCGPVPIAAGLDYMCQVLTALTCAHAHGVIHRDITPANIIVTPEGKVKLTDFGLAKSPVDQSLTKSGAMMGSPHYMAPEQVRGGHADARTDIYAVGAILYEIATGRKAFAADCAFSTLRAHIDGTPAPPIEVDHGLPPALNDAILTALQSDPAQRFQTADQFRTALERVRPVPAPVAPKVRARGPFLFLTAGAAVAGLLLFAGIVGVRNYASRDFALPPLPPPPSPVARAEVALTPPSPPPERPTPLPEEKKTDTRPRVLVKPTVRASSQPVPVAPAIPAPREVKPPAPEPPQAAAPAAEPVTTAEVETNTTPKHTQETPPEPPQKSSRLRRLLAKIRHPFK